MAAVLQACGGDSVPRLKEKAQAAIAAKDDRTAEIHLKNLLQKNETDADARLMLAKVHSSNYDWRAAEKEARRALSLGAGKSDAIPVLLEALAHTLDPSKLEGELAGLQAEDAPTRALIQYWAGQAKLRMGKPAEARRYFEAARELDGKLVKAQAGLLALQFAEGRDQAVASKMIDELVTRFPESTEALMLRADVQIARSDFDAARETLRNILSITPKDIYVKSRLVGLEIRQKNFDEASRLVKEVLARAPGWPVALTQRAEIEVSRGNMDAARESIQNAIRSGPGYPPAVAVAAVVALMSGSLEQAEGYGKQLVEIEPKSTRGYRLLAATYLKKGDADRALGILKVPLAAGAQDPDLHAIAGEASLRNNDAAAALRHFENAIKIDANDPAKRSGAAMARLAMGDTQAGLEGLQQAAGMSSSVTPADFLLVDMLLRNKESDRALAAVDDLERRQGKPTAISHELRGKVQLVKGDAANARSSFQASLAADPLYFPPASKLAALDIAEKKNDDARRRIVPYLAKYPKNISALLAQAEVLQRTGASNAEVIEVLKRASVADPGDIRGALALSNVLRRSGEPREAVAVLMAAVQVQPNELLLHLALSDAYSQSGESQQALDSIGKALQLRPRDVSVHMRLGAIRLAAGKNEEALSSFSTARELAPTAPEPALAVASVLARTERVPQALRIAKDLQKGLPQNAAGWLLEGDLLAAGGGWKEAVKAYRGAFEIASEQSSIAVRLIGAMTKTGDSARASQLLERRLAAKPDDPVLRRFAGERDIEEKRFKSAIEHLERVLKVEPKDPVALNNIAWALYELKDPKSVSVAESAYAIARTNPLIVDTLATALVAFGDKARGLTMHREAIRLAPSAGLLRLHYAEALIKTGSPDLAKKELEVILNGKAPDTVLRAARERIRYLN